MSPRLAECTLTGRNLAFKHRRIVCVSRTKLNLSSCSDTKAPRYRSWTADNDVPVSFPCVRSDHSWSGGTLEHPVKGAICSVQGLKRDVLASAPELNAPRGVTVGRRRLKTRSHSEKTLTWKMSSTGLE